MASALRDPVPVSRGRALRALVFGARAHGFALFSLLVLRLCVQERSALIFASNSMLLYVVASTIWVVPVAIMSRRTDLWVVVAGGFVTWLTLWGGLFCHWRKSQVVESPSVRVMSYNVLGFNFETPSIVRILRDSAPDIAVLQELNPENAAAIERELSDRYPYRWLDARAGVTGGGIVSRIPFRQVPVGPLANVPWVGHPMLIAFSLHGREVNLLRMHAFSGPVNTNIRNEEAAAIATFAAGRSIPLIVAGDLNATDQNAAYRTIARHLLDSWREAGFGFGHTFPGEPTGPGSRPTIFGIAVPKWLVRIDYVFHSRDFVATSASTLPSDGASDHRPLLVSLSLQ